MFNEIEINDNVSANIIYVLCLGIFGLRTATILYCLYALGREAKRCLGVFIYMLCSVVFGIYSYALCDKFNH